ncbi:hypothetical protein GGI15_004285 [Coemansia interrupta]|uniref:Ribosome biogenesis protein SLX9 n=1 Tax=Coemansia interrupta TaxID=1126814 RepID=A0A9W8HB64_9FUNG|nr:hypothetical protein GGI15_004285 [Coemansia interrupta]
MPRATRTRQKTRTITTAAAPAPADIESAPVPLSTEAESTEPRVTKKEKRALKHNKWMDKMKQAHVAQRQEQRQKARSADKSALVRGMRSLDESLREVRAELAADYLLKLGKNTAAARAAEAGRRQQTTNEPRSQKARNRAAIREEKRFTQILVHPAFQANPLATIRQHLANTLSSQENGDSK